jgi:hypothetical protein
MEDLESVTASSEPVEDLGRAVGRSVVHDEDLAPDRQIDRQQAIDDRCHGADFVVDGN